MLVRAVHEPTVGPAPPTPPDPPEPPVATALVVEAVVPEPTGVEDALVGREVVEPGAVMPFDPLPEPPPLQPKQASRASDATLMTALMRRTLFLFCRRDYGRACHGSGILRTAVGPTHARVGSWAR